MENKTVKLSEFLKEHGAYEEFIKSFDKRWSPEEWSKYPDEAIASAFDWEDFEYPNGTASSEFSWKEAAQAEEFLENINEIWIELPNKENDMKWLLDVSIQRTDQEPHMNHNIEAYPESFEIVQNHDDLLATVKWNDMQCFDVVLHDNSFDESEWDALTQQVADVMEEMRMRFVG